MMAQDPGPADLSLGLNSINLIDARLGAVALSCSDDRFASMHNLLLPEAPQFVAGNFDSEGQVYSGWESGRNFRRTESHICDWVVVKLPVPGRIDLVDIDTSFFRGNYPYCAAVQACYSEENNLPDGQTSQDWETLLDSSLLKPHSHNVFPIKSVERWTHLRLQAYPDGGVARFRAYGRFLPPVADTGSIIELSSSLNGALGTAASDSFYSPISNLLLPGRAKNIGEGWETSRRRDRGHDWAIVKLGVPGLIEKLEVDTGCFKHNCPAECSVDAILVNSTAVNGMTAENMAWEPVLERTLLTPDTIHTFDRAALLAPVEASHVRLNIYPDGGVSRFRVHGRTLSK